MYSGVVLCLGVKHGLPFPKRAWIGYVSCLPTLCTRHSRRVDCFHRVKILLSSRSGRNRRVYRARNPRRGERCSNRDSAPGFRVELRLKVRGDSGGGEYGAPSPFMVTVDQVLEESKGQQTTHGPSHPRRRRGIAQTRRTGDSPRRSLWSAGNL